MFKFTCKNHLNTQKQNSTIIRQICNQNEWELILKSQKLVESVVKSSLVRVRRITLTTKWGFKLTISQRSLQKLIIIKVLGKHRHVMQIDVCRLPWKWFEVSLMTYAHIYSFLGKKKHSPFSRLNFRARRFLPMGAGLYRPNCILPANGAQGFSFSRVFRMLIKELVKQDTCISDNWLKPRTVVIFCADLAKIIL